MSDQRDQQKRKGGQGGQQQGGGGQKSDQQPQQPNQKPGQGGQEQGGSAHMATDQISFYDESLKKQIEGTFISDGKKIHIRSVYGNKSVPYGDLGACIDHNSQVLLVQKLLGELARDPGSSTFKDLQRQRDDQQLEPMQRPFVGGAGGGGAGAHP
jgi:hypothetical protein